VAAATADRRWLVAALACAAATARVACAQDTTILAQPVSVIARSDSQPADPPRYFPFTLTVARGDQSFAYRTLIVAVADEDEAIGVLRQTIGWKDNHLFVREECGGGNMWRCDVDHVFALRGGRLVPLGEEIGGSRSQGPGALYRNGYFVDMYDRLENNSLTTHAGAPSFALYLKESGGALAVDLDRTWKEGRAGYERNRKEIARIEANRAIDPRARDETLASLLLHNAALAAYCGRKAELEQTMRDAQRLLPAERRAAFEAVVRQVQPGELPAPRRS
jgi:hypothetical protein